MDQFAQNIEYTEWRSAVSLVPYMVIGHLARVLKMAADGWKAAAGSLGENKEQNIVLSLLTLRQQQYSTIDGLCLSRTFRQPILMMLAYRNIHGILFLSAPPPSQWPSLAVFSMNRIRLRVVYHIS